MTRTLYNVRIPADCMNRFESIVPTANFTWGGIRKGEMYVLAGHRGANEKSFLCYLTEAECVMVRLAIPNIQLETK